MAQYSLAPIRSSLEQFVFRGYHDLGYRVNPFATLRVMEDREGCP